ncbi:MAG: metal-dependent hydrolase [Oleiphilaceae bacterium]|nr:metal-dependent hydrolase [Oleiphilaceae bacterium]
MGRITSLLKGKSSKATASPIPVRHMDFGFQDNKEELYFYDNDPFATSFYAAFSLVIPKGEHFFIHSVRNYRDAIKDPELKERIRGFIGQEAIHSREHDAANASMEAHGLPRQQVEDRIEQLLWAIGKLPKPFQLAFTVALEHYTAIISYDTISSKERQEKFTGRTREFMLWHMMEELEHKSVAYDVFKEQVGNYFVRAGTMAPIAVGLFPVFVAIQLYLLQAQGDLTLKNIWKYRKGIASIYGPKGLISRITPAVLDYFRPGFHPNDHDSTAMLEDLKERFFGDEGSLNDNLTKVVQPQRPKTAVA